MNVHEQNAKASSGSGWLFVIAFTNVVCGLHVRQSKWEVNTCQTLEPPKLPLQMLAAPTDTFLGTYCIMMLLARPLNVLCVGRRFDHATAALLATTCDSSSIHTYCEYSLSAENTFVVALLSAARCFCCNYCCCIPRFPGARLDIWRRNINTTVYNSSTTVQYTTDAQADLIAIKSTYLPRATCSTCF